MICVIVVERLSLISILFFCCFTDIDLVLSYIYNLYVDFCLSGGVDSSVCAALLTKALDPSQVKKAKYSKEDKKS